MFLADHLESAVISSVGFKKRFGTLAARPGLLSPPTAERWFFER